MLGQDFMDDVIVAEMKEAAKGLMRTQRAEQLQRNQLARDFATDLGMPEDLTRNVLIPINTRPEQLVPLAIPTTEPPETDNPNSPARDLGLDVQDSIRDFFGMDRQPRSYTLNGETYYQIDRGDGRFEWLPERMVGEDFKVNPRSLGGPVYPINRERRPTN